MIVVMAVCGWGVTQCVTSINLMRFFSPESKIRQDYAWLEEHLGPLVPMEVVLRFDEGARLSMLERVELTKRIHSAVVKLDEPGPYAYAIDLDFCKGCGLCAAECPCGAIEMTPERI